MSPCSIFLSSYVFLCFSVSIYEDSVGHAFRRKINNPCLYQLAEFGIDAFKTKLGRRPLCFLVSLSCCTARSALPLPEINEGCLGPHEQAVILCEGEGGAGAARWLVASLSAHLSSSSLIAAPGTGVHAVGRACKTPLSWALSRSSGASHTHPELLSALDLCTCCSLFVGG